VRQIVRDTLDATVEPIIFAEALDLIEQHQTEGRRVYLVSASPEEIVEPLAEYLGVDGSIASRAVVDADGRYTGEMERYVYGPFKAEAMVALAEREGIDLDRSYAYSDSYTDVPMLEIVGRPVAVNPDRILAKAARDRGWEVRQFVRPVRMRNRVPAHSVSAAAAATVLTGATTAAVVMWRHIRRIPSTS
jgi:phosphoserine phosphatase